MQLEDIEEICKRDKINAFFYIQQGRMCCLVNNRKDKEKMNIINEFMIFNTKRKFIKLIKKLKNEEKCLKGWIITNFPEDFDYKKYGLKGFPFGMTAIKEKKIYIATGDDLNVMVTTLLHEVAHVRDKSWNKPENPHNESWSCEFTSLVNDYMRLK